MHATTHVIFYKSKIIFDLIYDLEITEIFILQRLILKNFSKKKPLFRYICTTNYDDGKRHNTTRRKQRRFQHF